MPTLFDIVDAANRRFEELFNSNKLNELVELYTSNGKILPPDKNKYERQAGNDRLVETSSYEHSLDKGNY
ncbi:unnamed protein product [Rotaria sp. Silwood1]|nr:unnamed protein product [Rotaria sp. Silwood1]CAF1660249.1 unnamed protein product [Rotaria sp. Silwood1]